MRYLTTAAVAAGAAAVFAASAAADTMHPRLAARLSGMGEHGVVNLVSQSEKSRLCWTFDLETSGLTGASIRDAHGMIVARLGSPFRAKACAAVPKKALGLIEAK